MLLLVTQNPSLLTDVETNLLHNSIDYKQVSSLLYAKDWIKLNSYSVILVDQDIAKEELLDFFIEAWKVLKEVQICLISLNKLDIKNEFINVIGVGDCCGHEKLTRFLRALPKRLSLIGTQHQKVLIVEDLDSPRQIISSLIKSIGYSVVEQASSVSEAMRKLSDEPISYFAIVTDIQMPKESGFVLIKEIREKLSLSYLPVIVLTSDPSEDNLLKSLKLGITAFLAKPPKKDILKAELEKCKRIVLEGLSPSIGTSSEIRLIEKALKSK